VEASYTWSKVIGWNINSDSGPNFVQALPYFALNRVVADYDRTHMFHISQIWELPFGKGKKMAANGPMAALLGGWQISQLWSSHRHPVRRLSDFAESAQLHTACRPGEANRGKVR
jgi:hypothetical protein